MRRFQFGISVAVLAIAACVSGCNSKLRYEKTVELQPGVDQRIIVDGPKKEQIVKIEIHADSAIETYVVLEKDYDKGGLSKKLVESKQGTEISFEVTIPAGEAFIIILSSLKKTAATVKATGG